MSRILTSRFYKRFLSALLLGPICLAIIAFGGVPFYVLIGIITGLSFAEWIGMARRLGGYDAFLMSLAGLAYITMCVAAFLALPPYLNLLLVIGVWASDIGAYIIGKKFGRWKMFPDISPNKTLAGFAGACVVPALTATLIAFVVNITILHEAPSICRFTPAAIGDDIKFIDPFNIMSYQIVFISFFLIGVTGQAGDLLISALKRKVGVKDTGTLIPGHGGILDRIDAMLLASLVFTVFLIGMKGALC